MFNLKEGLFKIINLTPHAVNIVDVDGKEIAKFAPIFPSARCTQTNTVVSMLGEIPITETTFGEIYDLPEEDGETMYIVSRIVLSAAKGRKDLLTPNQVVRDGDGNIVGCQSLAKS